MAKKMIVEFGGCKLTGKLERAKTYFSLNDIEGIYKSQYMLPTTKSLNTDTTTYKFIRLVHGIEGNRKFSVGMSSNKKSFRVFAEIDCADGSGRDLCIAERDIRNKIFLKACTIKENGTMVDYDTEKFSTVIKLALYPFVTEDDEAMSAARKLADYCQHDPDDTFWDIQDNVETLYKLMSLYSNNIYFRIKNYVAAGTKALDYTIIPQRLTSNDIRKNKVETVIYGDEPLNFSMASKVKSVEAGARKGEDRKGLYQLMPEISLTEEENKLVPIMPDWYVWPMWTEVEAKLIAKSSRFAVPFRSLLLYGVSGTGKTEGAKAIFSLLGLPYGSVSCSVDMTMFDFFGQIIPNVKKWGNRSTEEVAAELGLPTFDDVANDFKNAYKKLFGVEPDEFAAPEDCYKALSVRMMGNGDEADFVYEETEFVKAYRNGWGIEIQEPTIIKRNSVLAGLNKALDNDPEMASITLPTGEVVRRHPRFVCIMTTNRDYDGCSTIQQSVLSRMQNERRIANPEIEELVARVSKETGFVDKNALTKMTSMIRKINEYCNVSDVTDGVCGPRELSNWAKRAMMLQMLESESDDNPTSIDEENIVRAAFPTVLEKVSQVSEDQESIIVEVFQKDYEEGMVINARDDYESGVA